MSLGFFTSAGQILLSFWPICSLSIAFGLLSLPMDSIRCAVLLCMPLPLQHNALSYTLHPGSVGFACLTVSCKAESARTLSILLKLIKAFSLTLMGVQSSFGMQLHILNSWWFLAGPNGTKPLQCRPKVCTYLPLTCTGARHIVAIEGLVLRLVMHFRDLVWKILYMHSSVL